MGMFKDLRDIDREAKKIRRNSPRVGVRLAEGSQKMAALTDALQSSTVALARSPGSVPVEAQVVSVEPTGHLNGEPIVTISALVLMNGTPPIPVTQSTVVPAMHVHRLRAGVRLPAHIDPHDVEAFALDWNAPVI